MFSSYVNKERKRKLTERKIEIRFYFGKSMPGAFSDRTVTATKTTAAKTTAATATAATAATATAYSFEASPGIYA